MRKVHFVWSLLNLVVSLQAITYKIKYASVE
ncbi:MAG: hypothetical protein PWR20_171 [Bacteroidales bacterium]|jgi:hypothetical protein|nr:hypothetical protein [Bacteroidales bacterium]MDN5328465.1 hypothetical protein [Bacteroidales bacterium]